ncbi:MAG: hypothetical protein O9246_01135 [Brevundimonas sp.]|nr:hypothetical protein [Brevundimonas sp.]
MINEANARALAQLAQEALRGRPVGAVGSKHYQLRLVIALLASGTSQTEVAAFAQRLEIDRKIGTP